MPRPVDLLRVGRVVEQHREPGVARPHRLLVADRERRRLAAPHHATVSRVRPVMPRPPSRASRDGAPVLHRTCSGPPTDSPSGWPRCQRSVGRMRPPTSSPSTNSARRQAPPRAQRTSPAATIGAQRLLEPAVGRVRVLPPGLGLPHQRLAPRRAVALILRDGHVLAPAAIAAADAVAGRDSSPESRRTTVPCTPRTRSGCRGTGRTRANSAYRLHHAGTTRFLAKTSGREKFIAGVTPRDRVEKWFLRIMQPAKGHATGARSASTLSPDAGHAGPLGSPTLWRGGTRNRPRPTSAARPLP